MNGGRPKRIRSVLKLARRSEEEAQRTFADVAAEAEQAESAHTDAAQRLAEVANLDGREVRTPRELFAMHQRAALRASAEADADLRLREMLDEQLQARNELMGAIRRRRSLENLEERQAATQASLAAHAAQKALDELASMRRTRNRT